MAAKILKIYQKKSLEPLTGCLNHFIQSSVSLILSCHARMEPSSNLSPRKLDCSSPSTILSLSWLSSFWNGLIFGRVLHSYMVGTSCLSRVLRTGSSMVRKCADMGIHTLNDWLTEENGTLCCLLLTLICLKLLLMEAQGRKQPAYKKHPGGWTDNAQNFKMGVFTFGWFGWTEDRTSYVFY